MIAGDISLNKTEWSTATVAAPTEYNVNSSHNISEMGSTNMLLDYTILENLLLVWSQKWLTILEACEIIRLSCVYNEHFILRMLLLEYYIHYTHKDKGFIPWVA